MLHQNNYYSKINNTTINKPLSIVLLVIVVVSAVSPPPLIESLLLELFAAAKVVNGAKMLFVTATNKLSLSLNRDTTAFSYFPLISHRILGMYIE